MLHGKVDALPALVPVTSADAYTAGAAAYLVRIARHVLCGVPDAVAESAVIARDGELVHPVVREHAEFYRARMGVAV